MGVSGLLEGVLVMNLVLLVSEGWPAPWLISAAASLGSA